MPAIILIGFMGTGKTAVGRRLSERLDREFIDLDAVIEQQEGMTIEKIFCRHGEPYFRALEKRAVAELSKRRNTVVAAGGGVVLDRENVRNLQKLGKLVHLTTRPEVIAERISGQHHRPLIEVEDRRRRIEEMMAVRLPFYAVADVDIDTSDLSVEEIAERIIDRLEESSHG